MPGICFFIDILVSGEILLTLYSDFAVSNITGAAPESTFSYISKINKFEYCSEFIYHSFSFHKGLSS